MCFHFFSGKISEDTSNESEDHLLVNYEESSSVSSILTTSQPVETGLTSSNSPGLNATHVMYGHGGLHRSTIPQQGLFTTLAAVEDYSSMSEALRAFVEGTNFETEELFLYSYEHNGSGMDRPALRSHSEDEHVYFQLYDACPFSGRTCDRRFSFYHFAARIKKATIKYVTVRGLRIGKATFPLGVPSNAELMSPAQVGALLNIEPTALANTARVHLTATNASITTVRALRHLPNLVELQFNKLCPPGSRYCGPRISWTVDMLQALKVPPLQNSLCRLSLGVVSKDLDPLSHLAGMNALTHLELQLWNTNWSDNSAWEDEIEWTASLPNLTMLFCNLLTPKIVPQLINNCPKLTELQLIPHDYPYNNSSILAALELLANNTKLATQLTALSVEKISPTALFKFTNLERLAVKQGVADIIKELPKRIPKLKVLHFGNYSKIATKPYRRFKHIEHLRLGYETHLTNRNIADFVHLPLRKLDLRCCGKITTTGLRRIIKACPNITDLNLRHAKGISSNAAPVIASLSHLRYFNVLSTGVSEKKVVKLARKFKPNKQPPIAYSNDCAFKYESIWERPPC